MIKSILLVVLLTGNAFAQAKPTIGNFRDFSGGINTHQAGTIIADNESPDLMNVSIDEIPGALTQRNGYLSCGSIPGGGTATNLYEYAKNNGSRQLIVTDNSSIWQTGDCVIYSTITSGQSAIAMPRFATIRDNLWIVNGSTFPIVWNGTSIVSRLDGVGTNPAAYPAKYIAYWKSRVWLANTPTAPSSVYFTSLTDDAGAELDPATSTSAWSALNQIYINRDDGSGITAMKVYRDNMLIGKPDSWSRIVFESEYDLAVAKNATTIGTKFNESVVEGDDGLLRYAGRDGLYIFDGITPKRLSTKWTPIYESMLQPQIAEQYKLWDVQSEFNNGSVSSVTALSVGALAISTYTTYPSGIPQTWTFGNGINKFSTATVFTATTISFGDSTSLDPFSYFGSVSAPSVANYGEWKFTLTVGEDPYLDDYGYGEIEYYFISSSANPLNSYGYSVYYNGVTTQLNRYANGVKTIMAQKASASPIIRLTRDMSGVFKLYENNVLGITHTDNTYVSSAAYNIVNSSAIVNAVFPSETERAFAIITLSLSTATFYYPAGVFTSEISTATGLTAWQTFSTDETRNGQSLSYEIRTAPSVASMATAVYRPIAPGAVVSTTTDGFAQWRASFATTDNSVTPTLDSASIGWLTGGSSKSTIYGINYKSRYWMSAATTTGNNYNDLMMVESKNPLYTYTRHDLPVSAMTLWNGNLYGSISNTGTIARLDFGSTDNGAAIRSYWTSKDFTGDNPIFYKTINRIILDYANNPQNTGLTVSLSPDEGATWQDRTINLSASTLSRNTAKLNYTANTALGFRTKVSNSVLGLGFKLYGLHPIGTFTEFLGN